MKKIILFALLLFFTLTLSACSNSELSSTLRRINRAQNYSIVTSMEMPGLSYSTIVKKDHDFLQFSSDFENFIMAKLDGRYFVYYPITANAWTREEIRESDFINDTNFVAPIDHLKASWFDEVDGAYHLKERRYDDFLDHDFFKDYQIDSIILFVLEVSENGLYWQLNYSLNNEVVTINAIFYDFDMTSISVPNVS